MKRVFRLFPPRRQTIKEKRIAECYDRTPEGQVIVRLRLTSPNALLMPFEGFPANFGHEHDRCPAPILNLNKDFVDYLFARLAELEDESLILQINLANDADDQSVPNYSANVLRTAIQRYFNHLEDIRRQDLQKLAGDAVLLGLLGATALGISVFLESQTVASETDIG
jgi:hypothetical protein